MKFMVKCGGILIVSDNIRLKSWTDRYGQYVIVNGDTFCWNRTDMTAKAYVEDITSRIEKAVREMHAQHIDEFVFIIDLNNPYADITGKEK